MANEHTHFLKSFPRHREPLPPEYKKIYLDEIRINRGKSGGWFYNLLVKIESWMHHQVSVPPCQNEVLEIGAGTFNHLPYEPEASAYDAIEPLQDLYEGSDNKLRIREIFKDIAQVPKNNRYSRIVSTAVLEHIEDLPKCIAQAGLLLGLGSELRVAVPSEGGFLWGLSWRLTTGLLFRIRTGLDYKRLIRYEHINTVDDIERVIRIFFKTVDVRRYPLPTKHLSFYTYIKAQNPDRDLCTIWSQTDRTGFDAGP